MSVTDSLIPRAFSTPVREPGFVYSEEAIAKFCHDWKASKVAIHKILHAFRSSLEHSKEFNVSLAIDQLTSNVQAIQSIYYDAIENPGQFEPRTTCNLPTTQCKLLTIGLVSTVVLAGSSVAGALIYLNDQPSMGIRWAYIGGSIACAFSSLTALVLTTLWSNKEQPAATLSMLVDHCNIIRDTQANIKVLEEYRLASPELRSKLQHKLIYDIRS